MPKILTDEEIFQIELGCSNALFCDIPIVRNLIHTIRTERSKIQRSPIPIMKNFYIIKFVCSEGTYEDYNEFHALVTAFTEKDKAEAFLKKANDILQACKNERDTYLQRTATNGFVDPNMTWEKWVPIKDRIVQRHTAQMDPVIRNCKDIYSLHPEYHPRFSIEEVALYEEKHPETCQS